ncbi:ankyrin repeat-containing domain protein [Talaromyces proteolyticus]|uniref:Ankyrin repeat-containing domain protein n=1 Tax=Talaromyces proteolyticus TaxID=1131652 RepID=A0AAD4KJM0_9EURO|nr:ankyrin repeat-containing domain protein [Talaromyces proteolyticus]KAH8690016.1 ankyrin repeat-containing domain protein [Talaromyces proteolyticus]
MSASLRARILLSGSYSVARYRTRTFLAISNVSTRLAELTGADNEQAARIRETIALAAAQSGNPTCDVLDKDHTIKGENTRRQNLISGAIITGNLSLTMSLFKELGKSVGVNKKSEYFGRPLHLAAAWGHIEIVQYLLDNGADARRIVALTKNDFDHCRDLHHVYLWSRHVDRSPDGSPLRAAALSGHEAIVRLLLKPEYNIWPKFRPEYYRAILAATRSGHERILDMLFDVAGLDLDSIGKFKSQILIEAVRHDRENIVRHLLDSETDLNFTPRDILPRRLHGAALHAAAAQNRTAMIRLLLDAGASTKVMEGDSYKQFTPIETAARYGHTEAVSIFIEYGGSPNLAFFAATYGSQIHLMHFLVQQNLVNIDKPTLDCRCDRWTPGREAMTQAILAHNPRTIIWLLAKGVPIGIETGEAHHKVRYVWLPQVLPWIKNFVLGLTGGRHPGYDYWNRSHCFLLDAPFGIYLKEDTWEWFGKY